LILMKIESKKTVVKASAKEVFDFLSIPKNIEQLLPEKEVKDFSASEKSCSFKVQGGVIISLVQKELFPTEKIQMVSGEKSPFPFNLTIVIEALNNGEAEGYIQFDGEVNTFLKTIIKKP